MRKYLFAGVLLTLGFAGLSAFQFEADARRTSVSERLYLITVEDKLSKEEQAGQYAFDRAHSYLGFKIKHMGLVDVPGGFTDFAGDIDFKPGDLEDSTVAFTAQVTSIDTRVDARDNHLRSKDFFEVETYPEMRFKSTAIEKQGDRLLVKGNLTIKDVTKEIEIPVSIYGPIKDQRGAVRMGVVGSTVINRRDFNVNYGGNLPNGTAVLADNVAIDIQVESVKKKEEKADAGN
ncbi:MAG: polyisoprenoid-binding protein [Acidobacteria bacterium]|nr:MAG: polyisoprenoid-binding protein [Acidobacteriota bacterium]REJ97998.1 MAG: polyisoprenoid-binding protein [Acidobacteriota bacterium]REK16741.1 MAG: polyisoprenoid-binding protein [Acidobacteriota bacterium]REK42652.1 MAG: polyisoprenoid-binding protein [Acidobacteriota bacterium]